MTKMLIKLLSFLLFLSLSSAADQLEDEEEEIDIKEVKHEIDVLGGTLIEDIADYPYMVGVFTDEDYMIATGVLLTTTLVLTNAIEFIVSGKEIGKQNITVRVGTNQAYDYFEEFDVKWVYIHPLLYATRSEIYDIAVLELTEEVRVNDVEPSLSFASFKDSPTLHKSTVDMVQSRAVCVQLGFGSKKKEKSKSLSEGYLRSDVLQIMEWEKCQGQLNKAGRRWNVIPEYEICAQRASQGGCWNEMGSPLICDGKIFGLMSDHDADCKPNSPVIFVRVDVHEAFLESTVYCPDKCISK